MMSVNLESLIKESVEAAKGKDAQLEYQVTSSAETENITTEVTVRFDASGPEAHLSLKRLLEHLDREATIADVQLYGAPEKKVIVQGSVGSKLFKVLIVF